MLLVIPLIIIVTVNLPASESYKILVTGDQVRSHVMGQLTIAEELASRGHQVYIGIGSRYPDIKDVEKRGIKVVTYFMPKGVKYLCSDDVGELTAHIIFNTTDSERVKAQTESLPAMVYQDCIFMMNDKKFLDEVKSIDFDMAIIGTFVLGYCPLILPEYLGIRHITLTDVMFPWIIRLPALPSFYIVSSPWQITNLNSFKNRLNNLIVYLMFHFDVLLRLDTRLLDQYANGVSSWNELTAKSELYILQRDHILDDILPLTPNVIMLPGLTSKPSRPLPRALEQLMQAAESGVILMTFGSSTDMLPNEITIKFFEAFSKLNQTVFVKLPVRDLNVPANVKLFTWLPQNDILGHPKTMLFITHCGNNGQYESTYHGVPMIGFPLFAEQPSNCYRTIAKKFGICMNIHDFTSDELFSNIQEILTNKEYSDATKRASEVLRSEPMNAREKAAFWIEHVIKHGGGHLRSRALDMPFYQFLMLDILALIAAVMLLSACLFTITVKLIWKKIFSQRLVRKKAKKQ
jgi:UDP:flavonoid glycosyltransferase YjiC (YdhE family)